MITTGTRQLKEITDEELAVLIDISRCYGCKEFWGEVKITRINRHHNQGEIVITYQQHRLRDGMVAKWRMFFDYAHLRYFYAQDEPFDRFSKDYSVCENTQMFLWLMAQDFNVLEVLTVAPIVGRNGGKYDSHGYMVFDGYHDWNKDEGVRLFGRDNEEDAFKYAESNDDKDYRVFSLVEIEPIKKEEPR